MKVTEKGQITIPLAMRKKHGLSPRSEVRFIDQHDGVLVIKVTKSSRGKQALAALIRGGKIKGRTEEWLRLTRGES